jgi:Tfp pilus assembly protein PilO
MKFGLREVAFAIVLMAIPLGAWHFVFRPTNAQDVELQRLIEAKQAKLRAVNRATAVIGDLQKKISSLQEAIQFFQSKLPNEKEIDKVLQEVWKIAETNQLTTKSIRTLNRADYEKDPTVQHCEQPISMQLEGDYAGLYLFLQALENQPRIMRIRSMTLTKPDGDETDGSVHATLIMSFFFEGVPDNG